MWKKALEKVFCANRCLFSTYLGTLLLGQKKGWRQVQVRMSPGTHCPGFLLTSLECCKAGPLWAGWGSGALKVAGKLVSTYMYIQQVSPLKVEDSKPGYCNKKLDEYLCVELDTLDHYQ